MNNFWCSPWAIHGYRSTLLVSTAISYLKNGEKILCKTVNAGNKALAFN